MPPAPPPAPKKKDKTKSSSASTKPTSTGGGGGGAWGDNTDIAAAVSGTPASSGVTLAPGVLGGADPTDVAKFAKLVGILGLDDATHQDLLKQYQIQALMAGGDKTKLAGITDALTPTMMQAYQTQQARKSFMADQLAQQAAAQQLMGPLMQQAQERAQNSGRQAAQLSASYDQWLPGELKGMGAAMAQRQQVNGDQLGQAYAQQIMAQPMLQQLAANKAFEAQMAQQAQAQQSSAGGGDFAAVLAQALGK